MLNKMTGGLNFHSDALLLRAERQRVISSNIANADTPGYVARDFNFAKTLKAAQGENGTVRKALQAASTSHPEHMPLPTENLAQTARARWPMPCPPSPAWTTTPWIWTVSAPTLWTTPCAMKPRCVSSTGIPRPCSAPSPANKH